MKICCTNIRFFYLIFHRRLEVVANRFLFYFDFCLFVLDTSHVVHLGFEDSTINVDEVSYENHDFEDNETNRYIELLK